MKEHSLDARALEIGTLIRGRLEKLAAEHPVIADVRGRGAMQAIELCTPGTERPRRRPRSCRVGVLPQVRRRHPHLRHLGQRVPLPASRWPSPTGCSTRRFDVVAEAFAATA